MATVYDSIHSTMASINAIMAKAAVRKGARDAFADMSPPPAQAAGGKTLLHNMRRVAAGAVKDGMRSGTTNADWVRTRRDGHSGDIRDHPYRHHQQCRILGLLLRVHPECPTRELGGQHQ